LVGADDPTELDAFHAHGREYSAEASRFSCADDANLEWTRSALSSMLSDRSGEPPTDASPQGSLAMETLLLPDLPPRATDSHKGSHGRVLVVAGSGRYPGAAILAALGAGRGGAGLVHLAVPEGVAPIVVPAVPFAILEPGAAEPGGGFDVGAAPRLIERARSMDAVVLGPGLGDAEATGGFVSALIAGVEGPLVLDADGLNHLARIGLTALARRPGPTILTPHPGEFARLDGGTTPIGADRQARAAGLARTHGVVVVLKGQGTVVTDGQALRVEEAGNAGMATGGMGDVLSGLLGTLAAQLGDTLGAAALAVHIHALAGDLAAAELGQQAVLPVDVADRLGLAFRRFREAPTGGGRAPP
jgi:NAD(P)H-hydrate epimerase